MDEIAILRDAGISNVNIDLIAGLPGQTIARGMTSLSWVSAVDPPHVSIYMLEVDDESRLGKEVLLNGKRYGAPDVPSDETIAELYETAVRHLRDSGIERYEISNFARPGFESLHNLKYWRLEPYLGFGADAHSFDGFSALAECRIGGRVCQRACKPPGAPGSAATKPARPKRSSSSVCG